MADVRPVASGGRLTPVSRGLLAPGRVLSASLVCVAAFEILVRLHPSLGLRLAGWTAMALVVATAVGRYGIRERYLLGLCALLAVAAVSAKGDAARVLGQALDQAAFLMAFVLLLSLLQEAASTSPAIEAVGRFMTAQPSGRRYQALCSGSAALSVLFNLGTVAFLVPLVQRGIARTTPGDPLNPVRERRQITAVQRGFGWAVIWSPTAIAPLTVMQLIDGISRLRWSLLGLGIFAVVLAIGRIEDALRFRRLRPAAPRGPAPVPWPALGRLAAACGWLFGLAAGASWLTGDSIVFGLMIACPAMLAGWLAVQHAQAGGPRGALGATRDRLGRIAGNELPRSAALSVTLAASGFVGILAAALVPVERVATALRLDAVPDFVLLGGLPLVILAMSLAALSPITLAVFFGSAFGALPILPADPTLIALAISCGWALAMMMSPFATLVLLIERVSGIPGRTLTWRWNTAFTTAAVAVLFAAFALLTGGT